MRVIRASQHVAMPWKNGGGTATDILAAPPNAGYDDFDWRLSGAVVAKAGPFSLFPHVDRLMLILEGGRLVLHGVPHEPAILDPASEPFAFPGDIPVTAEVPDGPIRNLNVMTDRRRFRSTAWRLKGPETVPVLGTLIVYCEAGEIAAGGERLKADDALVAHEAVAVAGEGRAIAIEILPIG